MIQFLGNFFHLCHYSFLLYFIGTSKSTGLILKPLTIADSLVILCKIVPQTTAALGLEHFLNNIGYKLFSMFTGWAGTDALVLPSLMHCLGYHNMFYMLQVSEPKLQALHYIRFPTILNMLVNSIFSCVWDWQVNEQKHHGERGLGRLFCHSYITT